MRRRRGARPGRAALVVPGALLLVGIGLRVAALVGYFPALLIQNTHDGAGYIAAARRGFFTTGDEPSGYPSFLALLHAISHELWFTIAVQHALGLAAGFLLMLAVRRLGAPLLGALAPAAVLWLGGDQLFLEQAPLSEALFTFFLALAVYAMVRTLEGSRRWAAILGASAAAMLVTRTVGVPLAAVVAGGVTLAAWRLRLGWRPAALTVASLVVLTAAYSVATGARTGHFSPLAGGTGWNLYMRAAEFADCAKFTPPPGAAVLCESAPPDMRPGPGYYRWLGGPAIRAFGVNRRNDVVRSFALAAITHQPGSYVALAATDLVRYVAPGFGGLRYDDFGGPSTVRFPSGPLAVDPAAARQVRAYYGPGSVPSGAPPAFLHDYQRFVRVTGPMLLLALIVAVAGSIAAAGRTRWGMLLMTAFAAELLLVPTLTAATWRYAVPAEGPLVCAAAVGAWALADRRRAARTRRQALGTRVDSLPAEPKSTTIAAPR